MDVALHQESVLDPRGGSLLVNRLPLLGDACKLMCKADRCIKKPSLERPCGCSEEGFASTHRESEKGSSREPVSILSYRHTVPERMRAGLFIGLPRRVLLGNLLHYELPLLLR